MRSVKINRQSLYQSRRYTNNLPITGPRETDIEHFFRSRRVPTGGRDLLKENSSPTLSRSSLTSTSFPKDSKRKRKKIPFMRDIHVLDKELHKPRLESKLKLSASLPQNFQRLSQYNAPSVSRLCIFKERH